jgi:hypothetical protein
VKHSRWKQSTAMLLLSAVLGQGCAAPGARLQYLIGDEKALEHYRDYATSIEYPVESEKSETNPDLFRAPRTISSIEEFTRRPVRLEECVKLALSNAAIIRDDQSFGSPGNPLMASPSRVPSVYDTGIQETGFLFGNRGVEAALSDFDALFTNSLQMGRSEDYQNSQNLGLNAGDILEEDTGQWQARLEKPLANSGTVALEHSWNYSKNNNTRLFPSAYTGSLQAEYRQPLLAGAGTEFTRIAGPLAQGLRGVSGVSQGVLISRINTDISLVDFEQSVATLTRDVENKFWDLYLALQLYHSEVHSFKDIVKFKDDLLVRTESADAEYQALNRLYEADARMRGSLADVLSAEQRLRRLMGLPLNDGQFLTPVEVPTEARLIPNWESSLLESLAHRPELRKQKWEIRSLELQLKAAKNLSRPRLDFVSQYRVNGFGDNLLGNEDSPGGTGLESAYETMTRGDATGWGLGFQFSMPLGLRLVRAQVRNYELRLRKARVALQEQEVEVARELANAILEMDRWYELADRGAKRAMVSSDLAIATETRVTSEDQRDPISLGRLLDAKITSRDADQGYLRSIVEYNKAITELNFRKGTLLQSNSVYLAEGEWNPGAYDDALRRAEATTHALDNSHVEAKPSEFVAGPAPTAWESSGNLERPFYPGVVEGTLRPQGWDTPGQVPQIWPQTPSPQQPVPSTPAPGTPVPMPPGDSGTQPMPPLQPVPMPKRSPPSIQDATQYQLQPTIPPIPPTQETTNDEQQKRNAARSRTSATGKPTLK